MTRLFVSSCLALWLLAFETQGASRSLPSPRVVLVTVSRVFPDSGWSGLERRLAAELKQAGFEVVESSTKAIDIDSLLRDLGMTADEHNAIAAVCAVLTGGAGFVRILVADELTSKTVLREIPTPPSRDLVAAGDMALHVVELMRASLLEIRVLERNPGSPAIPGPVAELIEERPDQTGEDRWHLDLAAGAASSFGDPAAFPTVSAGLGLRVLPGAWIGLHASGSLFPGQVENERGTARLGFVSAGVRLAYEPLADAEFRPRMGLGYGALIGWVRGQAAPGFEGENDTTAVSAIEVEMAAVLDLTERLSLRPGIVALVAPRPLVVRFAGREAARVGLPLIDLQLGLRWIL